MPEIDYVYKANRERLMYSELSIAWYTAHPYTPLDETIV